MFLSLQMSQAELSRSVNNLVRNLIQISSNRTVPLVLILP